MQQSGPVAGTRVVRKNTTRSPPAWHGVLERRGLHLCTALPGSTTGSCCWIQAPTCTPALAHVYGLGAWQLMEADEPGS